MSDDNVVPFKRRPLTNPPHTGDRPMTECDDPVHVFESIPGRCQCGERLWVDTPEHDIVAWEGGTE